MLHMSCEATQILKSPQTNTHINSLKRISHQVRNMALCFLVLVEDDADFQIVSYFCFSYIHPCNNIIANLVLAKQGILYMVVR